MTLQSDILDCYPTNMPTRLRLPRLINMASLALGIALGQGVMLLALTRLLHHGEALLVAEVGLSYAFISLAFYTADWGSTVTQSRATASHHVHRILPIHLLIRRSPGIVLLVLGSILISHEPFGPLGAFSSRIVIWACISSVFWSLNLIGHLDGRDLAGVSGLAAAIPPLFFSVPLLVGEANADAGAVGDQVGLALTLGTILSLLIQYTVCSFQPSTSFRLRCTLRGSLRDATEGFWVYLGWLPGQLSARGQILLVFYFLDGTTAGLFVYARQILNGVLQIVAIVRRVEFPSLVRGLIHSDDDRWMYQKHYIRRSLLSAFTIYAAATLGLLLVLPFLDDDLASACQLSLALIILVLPSSIAESMTNLLLADQRPSLNAALQWIYVVGSLCFTAIILPYGGVIGLIFVTFLALMIRIAIAAQVLASVNRR